MGWEIIPSHTYRIAYLPSTTSNDSVTREYLSADILNHSTRQYTYGGCEKCYYYSMLFGGKYKGRDITTEEEFEIAKCEFVKHFNEEHKDLMEKREDVPKKSYKKIERSESKYIYSYSYGHTYIAEVR